MSNYNKTIWQDGDTITAEALNNIEEGIEKTVVNVAALMEELGLNKTTLEENISIIKEVL